MHACILLFDNLRKLNLVICLILLQNQFKIQMEFDWYGFSKMNQDNPQIDKFESIIRNADISKNLQNVPTSFRKKLLTSFQLMSSKVKNQSQTFSRQTQSQIAKRKFISQQLTNMQKQAETSKQQLSKLKASVTEKKKLVIKLKEKISTLKKNKGVCKYFCPFCQTDEFISQQAFSYHMFSLHGATNANMANKSGTSNNQSTHNQLKDLLITMKDKQMEMMQMIFSQKKQQEFQQLQKFYEYSRKNFLNQNRTDPLSFSEQQNRYMAIHNSNELQGSPNDKYNDLQQLKGNSQYLFFQKSQQYKREAELQQDKIKSMSNYMKRNSDPYYDIFRNIKENKSQSIEEVQKRMHKNYSQKQAKTSNISEEHESILARFSNPVFSQNAITNQKQVKINPLKLNPNQQVYLQQYYNKNPSSINYDNNPSITDRLKQNITSNYYTSKNKGSEKINKDDGYIFNSGPLVQDIGGDSDYQDYFGKRKVQKYFHDNEEVQDQQIKINPGSYSFVSQSSDGRRQISPQLISPNKSDLSMHNQKIQNQQKNSNSIKHPFNNQLQKSSEIVDLSDSFSKRDFQLSKDDSSINLSDLKLSKLEKRRQDDQQKIKIQTQSQVNSDKLLKVKASQNNQNNKFSKNAHFVLVTQNDDQYIKDKPVEKATNKISYLLQFAKRGQQQPIIQPLKPQSFSFNKKQTYNLAEYYKPNEVKMNQFKSYQNNDLGYEPQSFQPPTRNQHQTLKDFEKQESQPIGAQAFFMKHQNMSNQLNKESYMRSSKTNNFISIKKNQENSQDAGSSFNILSRFYKQEFVGPSSNSKVVVPLPQKDIGGSSSSNSVVGNENREGVGPLAQYYRNT